MGALLTTSVSLIVPALMAVSLWGRELSAAGWAGAGLALVAGVACAFIGASSALESLNAKLAAAAALKAA